MVLKFNPFTGKLDYSVDPAGLDTQVQFNNGGAFGASANLTWNTATNILTVTDGTRTSAFNSGTNAVTLDDASRHARFINSTSDYAAQFQNSPFLVTLSDFTNKIAGYFFDGTRSASLVSNTGNYAGSFSNTGQSAILCDGTQSAYFSAGSGVLRVGQAGNMLGVYGLTELRNVQPETTLLYSMGTSALRWKEGYFGDGVRTVNLTNGTYAIETTGNIHMNAGGQLQTNRINIVTPNDVDIGDMNGYGVRAARFGVQEGGGTPTNFTYIQGGVQAIDLTYTLPTAYPAVNGYVLAATTAGVMSWVAQTGPAGLDTYVQFNDGGVFGGNIGFVYDKTNHYVGMFSGAASGSPTYPLHLQGNPDLASGDYALMRKLVDCVNPIDSAAIVEADFTSLHTNSGAHNYTGTLLSTVNETANNGTGTVREGVGLLSYTTNNSTGIITYAEGIVSEVWNEGNGNITNAYGLSSSIWNDGAGTITNSYGIYVETATNGGGGTVTNNYGLYLKDQSAVGSTLSYNVYSAGATSKNKFEGKVIVDGNIDASSTSIFYFGDETTDGSWRIERNGTDLLFQRRESGSWITKSTITA